MRIPIPWRIIARHVIEILPLVGAVTVVSMAFNQIADFKGESEHVIVIILGLLLGIVLAWTRFPGWAALLYSSVVSLFTAFEVASDFLPLATVKDFGENLGLIDFMHRQWVYFFDLVLSWWSAYTLGDPIRERTILILVMGILLWNLAAWSAWWTLRRRQALIGAIPLGLVLAFVVDRSGLSLGYLQNFCLFVFISHVSVEITSRYRDWDKRKIDYPEGLEVEWGTSALLIIGFVLLSSRALPMLATPDGWDTIRKWLEREEITVTVDRGISIKQSESIAAADSSTPELGVIGAPPASGDAVVMWVEISDPSPLAVEIPGSQAPPQHYWRSQIYTTYTGRGWETLDVEAYSVEPDNINTPRGRYLLSQTYTLDTTKVNALYAVNQPYVFRDSSGERYLDGEGVIPPLEKGSYTYTIESWATSPNLVELQAAPSSYPEDIIEIYLQLPEDLPVRIGDLSARLTRGLSNNYEKAKRIETYLRATYPYDLDVPKATDNRDVVDYFLFEAQKGFCSYTSSAMVVMLRSIGIPARVVSGYAMGLYDPERDAYKVVEGDSHAWVEVYFPELGWIEFEPTAGRVSFNYSGQFPTTTTMDEPSSARMPSSQRKLFLYIGGVGLLMLTLLVGIKVLSQYRQERFDLRELGVAGRIYNEMRNNLYRIGFGGHPAQTPHEYLSSLEGELPSGSAIIQSLHQVTEVYTRVRFGGFKLSEEHVQDLQQMWKQNKWKWISFLLKHQVSALWGDLMGRIHWSDWSHDGNRPTIKP